jgi:hypothetical protein
MRITKELDERRGLKGKQFDETVKGRNLQDRAERR